MSTLKDRWLRRAAYPGGYNEMSYTGAEYAPGFTDAGPGREGSPQMLVRRAREAHSANGIVFACQAVKQALFSEARFQYQKLTDGSVFGDTSLKLLEHPWPNADTGELLSRMCLDGALASGASNTAQTSVTVPIRASRRAAGTRCWCSSAPRPR